MGPFGSICHMSLMWIQIEPMGPRPMAIGTMVASLAEQSKPVSCATGSEMAAGICKSTAPSALQASARESYKRPK